MHNIGVMDGPRGGPGPRDTVTVAPELNSTLQLEVKQIHAVKIMNTHTIEKLLQCELGVIIQFTVPSW